MRTTLTALISAGSFCALASAASAQTIPSNTGAPPYSYESQLPPQPAAVGSCDIVAGNRVCSANPTYAAPAPGYSPGYGPVGAIVAAPFDAAGTVVTAPFGMFGAAPGTPVVYGGGAGTPYVGGSMTNPAAAGTAIYSYESRVPPQPGAIGYCDLIAGNHVCFTGP
jgi:hypothetical protein